MRATIERSWILQKKPVAAVSQLRKEFVRTSISIRRDTENDFSILHSGERNDLRLTKSTPRSAHTVRNPSTTPRRMWLDVPTRCVRRAGHLFDQAISSWRSVVTSMSYHRR